MVIIKMPHRLPLHSIRNTLYFLVFTVFHFAFIQPHHLCLKQIQRIVSHLAFVFHFSTHRHFHSSQNFIYKLCLRLSFLPSSRFLFLSFYLTFALASNAAICMVTLFLVWIFRENTLDRADGFRTNARISVPLVNFNIHWYGIALAWCFSCFCHCFWRCFAVVMVLLSCCLQHFVSIIAFPCIQTQYIERRSNVLGQRWTRII